jgi:single-strand DNA-binding protein
MNKVMLIGRLGAAPEVKASQNGNPVARLKIATDESYTDRDGKRVERAEWHSVIVFQRQAENCAKFLDKGSLVFVEGKLTTRKWQDQSGQDRYTTEVRADRVEFLSRKNDAGDNTANDQRTAPRTAQTRENYDPLSAPTMQQTQGGFEDVPF